MKYFICGTHNCGKTQMLSGIECDVKKISGLTKKLNFGIELDYDDKDFIDFQLKMLTLSIAEWISEESFISSNSIFNIMAYIKEGIDLLNVTDLRTLNKIEKSTLKSLTAMMTLCDDYVKIFHTNKKNNVYFLIKPEFNVENYDKHQRTIQHYIEFFIQKYGIQYILVSQNTIEDKISFINEAMKIYY